jgi:hypothetical protein
MWSQSKLLNLKEYNTGINKIKIHKTPTMWTNLELKLKLIYEKKETKILAHKYCRFQGDIRLSQREKGVGWQLFLL